MALSFLAKFGSRTALFKVGLISFTDELLAQVCSRTVFFPRASLQSFLASVFVVALLCLQTRTIIPSVSALSSAALWNRFARPNFLLRTSLQTFLVPKLLSALVICILERIFRYLPHLFSAEAQPSNVPTLAKFS